ncbi:MAG: hypothetical protein ACXVQR_02035 [Solirubrobacteraceae bacterium]
MVTAMTEPRDTVHDDGIALLSSREPRHHCECGHVLRVFGGGRHRVYFELDDARLDQPVMNRVCPSCARILPGKNRP